MSDETPTPDPAAEGPPGPEAAAGRQARGEPDEASTPDQALDAEVVDAEVVDAETDEVVADAAADAGSDDDVADAEIVDDDLDQAAEQFEVDLELLLSEREQYLQAFRRAQADFENYRKQAQRRQDEAVVRALGGFVESLLPVFDSCDAALAHGATEVEPVLSALYSALGKEGLERIDPKGAPFDPAEAEAVMHEPGDGGEQVVAEVLRPGYRWRGRVLRPAMVKVTD